MGSGGFSCCYGFSPTIINNSITNNTTNGYDEGEEIGGYVRIDDLETLNAFMDRENDYKGTVKVLHFLEFLRDDVRFFWERIW